MKKNKLPLLHAILAFFFIGLLFQSCDKDETTSSEDLTVTIVGNYLFELRENEVLTTSNIAAVITKVNNNTIQIAITGRETVKATVVKPQTGSYFLINVIDQTDITNGTGGDFAGSEINVDFTKSGVTINYYGVKQ